MNRRNATYITLKDSHRHIGLPPLILAGLDFTLYPELIGYHLFVAPGPLSSKGCKGRATVRVRAIVAGRVLALTRTLRLPATSAARNRANIFENGRSLAS